MPRPIRAWRPAGDIVAPSQAATRWSPVGIRTRVVGLIQLRGHVLKGGHGLEPAAYASELSAICQSSSAVRSRRVADAPITVRDWIAQPPEWIEIVQVHGDAVDAVSGDLDIGELTSC